MLPLSEGVLIAGAAAALLMSVVKLTHLRDADYPGLRWPVLPVVLDLLAITLYAAGAMLIAYANEKTSGALSGTVALTIGLGAPSFFMTAAREIPRLQRLPLQQRRRPQA